MRILFFSSNFYPERNAAASRVYERACYWIKQGHEVTVITEAPNFPEGKLFSGYRNKFYQVEMIKGIRVLRVKTLIAANQGFWLRILDYVSYFPGAFLVGMWQKKFDVVVASTPTPFAALAAWSVAKLKKRQFVLEVSDLWPASILAVGAMRKSKLTQLLEKFELFLYRQASRVVVVTQAFQKNLVERGIACEKIRVILNGVDLSRYAPRPRNQALASRHRIAPQDFVVGYLGTLGMAQGLENVLAAAEILQSQPGIKFMFVGTGAEAGKLKKIAQTKNLLNVIFVEPQDKEKMPEFWSICNLALVHLKNSPVFSEVLPSKIFEACGMGLPILNVGPAGEAAQLIHAEKIGINLAPENPQILAETILQYSAKPELLREYAQNSQACGLKYTRERQALAMLEVFAEL